jgi:hypothetical protein
MIQLFKQYDQLKVQVIATKASLGFFDAVGLRERTGVNVWQDEEEWTASPQPEGRSFQSLIYRVVGMVKNWGSNSAH